MFIAHSSSMCGFTIKVSGLNMRVRMKQIGKARRLGRHSQPVS